MESSRPRILLIYYKSVVDKCVSRFLRDFTSQFTKSEDGRYVFSGGMTRAAVKKVLLSYVSAEVAALCPKYVESRPEFLVVLGSCVPGDNILLGGLGKRGERLARLVETAPDVRYFLKEADISIDVRLFNDVFDEIFVELFRRSRVLAPNAFFVRHSKLDCYMLFKLVKARFGRMAVNLHKEIGAEDSCILSVNDEIDRCSRSKVATLGTEAVSMAGDEACGYIEKCIREM